MSPLEGLPQVTAARPFSPPLPTGTASGWLIRQEELPLTSVQILIPGGRQEETTPGLTQLSDRLLLRGAGSRGSTALALELEQRAISMSVSTGPISTAIRFDCHRRQLPVATERRTPQKGSGPRVAQSNLSSARTSSV